MKRVTYAIVCAALAASPVLSAPPAVQLASPGSVVDMPQSVADGASPVDDAWGSDCGCDDCGPRYWASAEYLLWRMRDARLPPLVTTNAGTTAVEDAGVLGAANTSVLIGDERVNGDFHSGFRLGAGAWLDRDRSFGIEGSFFMLDDTSSQFAAASDGATILARPFFDVTNNEQSAQRIAFPGESRGNVTVSAQTTGLLGAGCLFRENIVRGPSCSFDVLGGYRYLRFSDGLEIRESRESLSGSAVGTRTDRLDTFETRNEMHAFDGGIAAEFAASRVSVRLLGKLAVGSNLQNVDVNGTTVTTPPSGTPTTINSGLLAQVTNNGNRQRSHVSLVPEFNAQLAYHISPRLRATLGYTFLYWTDVVRAGDQVNLAVNPLLLAPTSNPNAQPQQPAFRDSRPDVWFQGLDLGLEFRF